jgi:peroxidase
MNFLNTQSPFLGYNQSPFGSPFGGGFGGSPFGMQPFAYQPNSPFTSPFGGGFGGSPFGSPFGGGFGGSPFGQQGIDPQLLNAMINLVQGIVDLLQAVKDYQQQANPFNVDDGEYRSFDGSGNNPFYNQAGAAETQFMRIAPQDSSRGIGGATEANLPNAREISNAVFDQAGDTQNNKGLSDLFWVFGQFLDHDINLTLESDNHETANIPVPTGDPFFDPFNTGTQEMHFTRSNVVTDASGQRQQVNSITAFVDGSNIYGSSQAESDSLRSFEGGRLAESGSALLPKDENGMYQAGDIRANENAALISMHTLWMREHNRVADGLAAENPEWNDETIFQEARKEVIASLQAVTYNEFIPAMIGENTLDDYQGYNPHVNPQISETFATAAYRFGHTMLSPEIQRVDADGNEVAEGHLSLRDAFFQPQHIEQGGIDSVLRGVAGNTAQAVDAQLIDDVRNFLFGPPGAGGLDLASLNIQRGRDHELPSYNDLREAMGLRKIESFDDPIFQGDTGQRLASVYDNTDQIDAWVGGLAEQQHGDSALGETMTYVLKDQFERLRDGDRFFFENQFSGQKLEELNNLTFADIIERNTDIENLQENVFYAS